MKRVQLFEFEDFDWFPSWIRAAMTNLIVVLHKMMGTPDVLAKLIRDLRARVPFDQIVDLGSGSGGAMPMVLEKLNEQAEDKPLKLILTDLHPNPAFIKQVKNAGNPNLTFKEESVDAGKLADAPEGLKTMMNSFHHMPPEKAKGILKSAQDNRQPLLIYEIGENKIPFAVWLLMLPLSIIIMMIMVLFMTPFSRPITLPQIIFTYFIPLIPFFYAWDGQASMPRMYTFDDIEILLKDIRTEDYTWELGNPKNEKGKNVGYYVFGMPKATA